MERIEAYREIEILNNETRRREEAHGYNRANAWFRSRRSVLDCLRLHFDSCDEQIGGVASHDRVAVFTGFSVRTVQRAIDDLVDLNLTERVERRRADNGGRLPNGYKPRTG